eukprot:8675021-Lingulodinium_polyedra.AAC.1
MAPGPLKSSAGISHNHLDASNSSASSRLPPPGLAPAKACMAAACLLRAAMSMGVTRSLTFFGTCASVLGAGY